MILRKEKKFTFLGLSSASLSIFALATTFVVADAATVGNATIKQKETATHQSLTTEEYDELPSISLEVSSDLSKEYVAEEKRKAEAKRLALEEEKKRKLAEDEAAKKTSQDQLQNEASTPTLPLYSGGGTKDQWLEASGIPKEDWPYVDYIVNKESTWNPNAINSLSGASGLVQALPCEKVPGNCFDPVDNLKWANGYANDRYGGWKGAYEFWVSNNWW